MLILQYLAEIVNSTALHEKKKEEKTNYSVYINEAVVEQVNSLKFLGNSNTYNLTSHVSILEKKL